MYAIIVYNVGLMHMRLSDTN